MEFVYKYQVENLTKFKFRKATKQYVCYDPMCVKQTLYVCIVMSAKT